MLIQRLLGHVFVTFVAMAAFPVVALGQVPEEVPEPPTDATPGEAETPDVAAPVGIAAPAPAEESPAAETTGPDLVPRGEAARMADRSVSIEHIRFRPTKGLEIRSDDGDFTMALRVRAMFQEEATFPDVGGLDAAEQEFRLRRARFQVAGNVFGDIKYKLELAFSPNDVGIEDDLGDDLERRPSLAPVFDFWFQFAQVRDLNVHIGQYKIPFNRERVVSSGNLRMVDRSIANDEFNLDRDVGLDLRSEDFLGLDRFRYYAGVYIGRGRDSQGADDFHMVYLGRVEYLPFGMFDDYDYADLERTPDPKLSLGFAYVFLDHDRGLRRIADREPADGGTDTRHTLTADAIFKYRGFEAHGEFMWRNGERHPGDNVDAMGVPIPPTPSRDGLGWFLEAGYLIPRAPVEIAARYGMIRALGDSTSLEDRNELGGGLNWYLAGHAVKLHTDVFRLWQPGPADGVRVRAMLQVSI
jgi:hypothetical protein